MDAGLTTLLHEKLNVTETGTIDNDTTQSGGFAAGAAMILLGQNQREAQRPERERNKAAWKSWNVAKAARNREGWSENVSALCAYWRAEI